jgi:site-specific recombinase XerD
LAGPSQPLAAVPESSRRPEGGASRHPFTRSRRRADHLAQGARGLRDKKKITPHSPRYACATHLIEAGVDLLKVQRILSHRCILTTVKYTHLINDLMNGFSIDWGTVR